MCFIIFGLLVELLGALILALGLTGLTTKVEWKYDNETVSKYIYELNGIHWQRANTRGTARGGIKKKMDDLRKRTWLGVGCLWIGFISQTIGIIVG